MADKKAKAARRANGKADVTGARGQWRRLLSALGRLWLFLRGLIGGEGAPPRASRYDTLAFDGIAWEYLCPPPRVIAIGDVHGDLTKLGAILLEAQLIDGQGRWVGGAAHLVLVGDLVAGHEHSRLLVNFVMRIAREARDHGGAVHALLGNHDLIPAQANADRMTRRERRLYEDFPIPGAGKVKAKHAFRGHSVYAEWLRSRNAILKLGSTLFVHAGLGDWALDLDAGRINATVRAWIRFWQGVGEKPPKRTRWAVGKREMRRGSRWEIGPLWNRAFKPRGRKQKDRADGGPSRKQLETILEQYGASRMVIGHAPVPTGEVLLRHPYYDELVVMIDTRIGDDDRGTLSALEIRHDSGSARLRVLEAGKARHGQFLTAIELQALEQAGARPWLRGRFTFAKLKSWLWPF